jgi:hypothetical protein
MHSEKINALTMEILVAMYTTKISMVLTRLWHETLYHVFFEYNWKKFTLGHWFNIF